MRTKLLGTVILLFAASFPLFADKSDLEGTVMQFTATNLKTREVKRGRFRYDDQYVFEGKKRVADVTRRGKELTIIFNESSQLSGTATIINKSRGLWVGHLSDRSGQSWKLEIRRGED